MFTGWGKTQLRFFNQQPCWNISRSFTKKFWWGKCENEWQILSTQRFYVNKGIKHEELGWLQNRKKFTSICNRLICNNQKTINCTNVYEYADNRKHCTVFSFVLELRLR